MIFNLLIVLKTILFYTLNRCVFLNQVLLKATSATSSMTYYPDNSPSPLHFKQLRLLASMTRLDAHLLTNRKSHGRAHTIKSFLFPVSEVRGQNDRLVDTQLLSLSSFLKLFTMLLGIYTWLTIFSIQISKF